MVSFVPSKMMLISHFRYEIFKYFDEEVTKNEAIENIKINTRKYSKRQMTWFNRNKEIKWFRNKQDFINYFKN